MISMERMLESSHVFLEEEAFYSSQYGFLAQELQEIYPQLVLKDEETGYLRTKPLEMIPILVAALQDQQEQIDVQQKQIDNQQKQINDQQQQIDELKRLVEKLVANPVVKTEK